MFLKRKTKIIINASKSAIKESEREGKIKDINSIIFFPPKLSDEVKTIITGKIKAIPINSSMPPIADIIKRINISFLKPSANLFSNIKKYLINKIIPRLLEK